MRFLRCKILRQQLLVLLIKGFVLSFLCLQLVLETFDLFLELHHVQVFHISFPFLSFSFLAKESDRILKLLAVAVPVFELFDVFQGGQIQGGDSHLNHVLLSAGIGNILVVKS